MTRLQKFLMRFIPARHRAEAEADSRAWHMVCAACGHARSIWDLGGIKWKATGNSLTLARCPACGKRGKHQIIKR